MLRIALRFDQLPTRSKKRGSRKGIPNMSPYFRNRILSILSVLALVAVAPACDTDPDCPQGATIEFQNPSGECFNVSVSSNSGESFNELICGNREEVVNPGTYRYSVSQDGRTVASGTKNLACGETKSIVAVAGSASTDNLNENTSNGKPAGAIQLQCGCWGPAREGQTFNTTLCASGVAIAQPCYGVGFCSGGSLPWGRTCL